MSGLEQGGSPHDPSSLAVSQSGGTVAFGSTTGNLYVSEDRGDSWRTVANNLPPIYSVRFG